MGECWTEFHPLISTNKNTAASEQTRMPYCSWNLSVNSISELTSEMDVILALQRIKRLSFFWGHTLS